MSLDIWTVGEDDEILVSKNITHNLNKMWTVAGVYDALYHSDGVPAKEIIPELADGLERLKRDPYRFNPLSNPNGWGTYNQAVPWLEELIEELKGYPESIIHVSV